MKTVKKIILVCLLLWTGPNMVYGQCGIETGGEKTRTEIPTRIQSQYSLTQQIYTASEMQDAGDSITGIKFYLKSGANCTRNISVYMDTTSLGGYTVAADYIPQDSSKLYYTGNFTLAAVGWVEIVFDRAFVVPTGKNVVLTVCDNTGSSAGAHTFKAVQTSSAMTLRAYRNGASINPADDVSFMGIGQTMLYRSDVFFMTPCAECLSPTITSTEKNDTSITLHWNANDGQTWQVSWRHTDSITHWTAGPIITDTFYTVNGLNPNTCYLFRVLNLCDGRRSISTLTDTTPNTPVTLPFNEDFEAYVNPNFPPKWDRIVTGNTNTSIYIQPDGYNSSSSVFFSKKGASLLLPPVMANAGSSLSVSFYAFTDRPNERFIEVGMVLDPANAESYTVVDTITVEAGNSWELFTVYLDDYVGPDGRIFLRCAYPEADASWVWVDDIFVDYASNCRWIASTHVGYVGSDSVVVSAIDEYTRDSYTFFWGLTDSVMTDSITVNSSTAFIGGLFSDTTYYFQVCGNCGNLHSESRIFRPLHTGSTISVTKSQPWEDDLESGSYMNSTSVEPLHCEWEVNGADHWAGCTPYSGSHVAMLRSAYDREALLLLPTFDFSELDTNAYLSFYHYQIIFNNYTTPGTLTVYYRIGTEGAWQYLEAIDSTVSNEWVKRTIMLPASQGAAIYQVAIKGRTNSNYRGVCLDDFHVGPCLTCSDPTNVTVGDITDHQAVVRWTGNAPAYKVQYRRTNHWAWTSITIEGQDSCVIAPLEMNTQYEARIIGLCSNYEQTDAVTVHFITSYCTNNTSFTNFTIADTVSLMAPLSSHDIYHVCEILIDSAELAGMTEISALEYTVTSGTPDFTTTVMYMGHTTDDTLTSFHFSPTTFTRVYTSGIYQTSNNHMSPPSISLPAHTLWHSLLRSCGMVIVMSF